MSVSLPRDVFISYASEDKEAANAACKSLESEGIRCWIAPRNIAPGAKWERAIMDAINDSRLMVVLISEGANRSQHVEREVGSAFENGITVIPFRVSNTRPTGVLAYYLRSVQWIDAFTGSLEEHFEYLVRKVKDISPTKRNLVQ